MDSCRALEAEGFKITYLPVNASGLISLKDLKSAMQDDTSLVSVMTVNNEIGVKQPIAEIGKKNRYKLQTIFKNQILLSQQLFF